MVAALFSSRRVLLFQTQKKKANVLFNDALNTFYLRLYGVGHIVMIVREYTRCRHSFRIKARIFLYAPSHRHACTYYGLCYTSRGVLTETRSSSMGPPRGIDPTTHRTMSILRQRDATNYREQWLVYSLSVLHVIIKTKLIKIILKSEDSCDI